MGKESEQKHSKCQYEPTPTNPNDVEIGQEMEAARRWPWWKKFTVISISVLVALSVILGVTLRSSNEPKSVNNGSLANQNGTDAHPSNSSLVPVQDKLNKTFPTQTPLNSLTTKLPTSTTYLPPTVSSNHQETTTIKNEKIQPYNWNNQVKRIKQRADKDFYRISQLQNYFTKDVNDIFKNDMHDEISTEFYNHRLDNNFSFNLTIFDETLPFSIVEGNDFNNMNSDFESIADEYYDRFITKLTNTSGGYYRDEIIDFNNKISSLDRRIEYISIITEISHNKCNSTQIALPPIFTGKLSLAKENCKEQKNGYVIEDVKGQARIKDAIEVLAEQVTDDISFLRLINFNITGEDYLDLIKLLEIESEYKITIWFLISTFEPTNLCSFNWNKMISLRNPIIFDECRMHKYTESIWKYFRNQVDQPTIFYNTHYISTEAAQIENQ